jgi:hypothetical protein
MGETGPHRSPRLLIWVALVTSVVVPLAAAAFSPLLAWRAPVYIVAGFAGILAMVLLLVQPVLAGGYIPDLSTRMRRQMHRLVGAALVTAIVVHVGGSGSPAHRMFWTRFCSVRRLPSLSGA